MEKRMIDKIQEIMKSNFIDPPARESIERELYKRSGDPLIDASNEIQMYLTRSLCLIQRSINEGRPLSEGQLTGANLVINELLEAINEIPIECELTRKHR